MADEFLGLIKPEEEKELGKVVDDIVIWKNVFPKKQWLAIGLEAVDGKVFTSVIRELDDRLADKIPPDYKPDARKLLLAAIAKDWATVVEVAPAIINRKIDIPGIDEDTELVIIVGFAQVVYMAILAYANKQLKVE